MLDRKMKWYQEKALEYLHKRFEEGFKGGTLWMEMRLGKSWDALQFALDKDFKRVLILGPGKTLSAWVDETAYHNIPPLMFVGTPEKKEKLKKEIPNSKVTVATYESARLYGFFHDCWGWDCIILDETYKLAKLTSRKSRSVWEWRGKEFRIGLSGNPGAETPLDLVAQYIAVDGNLGPYTTPFSYCEKHTDIDQHGNLKLKPGRADDLRTWMRQNSYCMTRAEAGVGGGKIYEKIYCNLPPNLAKPYNRIVEDTIFDIQWNVNGEKIRLDPLRRMNWLWALTSGIKPMTEAKVSSTHKIDAAIAWMKENGKRKVVLTAHFVEECQIAARLLNGQGIVTECMTGTTTLKHQREVQEKFDSNEIESVVLQEDAFCMGLNFSASDVIIFISNSLSGDARSQFEDRVIHLSKSYDVLILDVCCRNAVDSYIADKVKDKTVTAKDLVTQGAVYLKEIERWAESDN